MVLILAHVFQTAVRMTRTEILMMRAHANSHTTGVSTHLVGATSHVVGHWYLALVSAGLLIEVLHLAVVRGVVVLAVVVMRWWVMSVGLPVERVVGIVLVGQGRIARRSDGRWWSCDHTAGVASQRSEVSVNARVGWDLRRFFLDGRRDWCWRRRDVCGRRHVVDSTGWQRRWLTWFSFRRGCRRPRWLVLLLLELLAAFGSAVFEPHLKQKTIYNLQKSTIRWFAKLTRHIKYPMTVGPHYSTSQR